MGDLLYPPAGDLLTELPSGGSLPRGFVAEADADLVVVGVDVVEGQAADRRWPFVRRAGRAVRRAGPRA